MRILILSFSEVNRDPRVIRHVVALGGHDITVCGYGPAVDKGFRLWDVSAFRPRIIDKIFQILKLGTRRFEMCYWNRSYIQSVVTRLADSRFDLILANDIYALPIAVRYSNAAKVVYDAHEFSPRQHDNTWIFRWFLKPFFTYLCRAYLPQCDRVITVCDGIAEEYARQFGISRPDVVTSAALSHEVPDDLTMPNRPFRLVHHGGINASRRLDLMIEAVDILGQDYELHFMLLGSKRQIDDLKRKSVGLPVYFHEPVAFAEIVPTIAQFDVGVYLLPPTNFNNEHALPNKFFEFIQARIPIAIGPSPEMARLVTVYNAGVVADTFEPQDLATAIRQLMNNYVGHKQAIQKMALEVNAESEAEKLRALVGELCREVTHIPVHTI